MNTSHWRQPYGYWTLVFLVVANMIGSGVFTTSGYSMVDLRSPGRVIVAWIIGGGLALAGAVSYGQLIRVMPKSGGEYLFLSRAIHPACGFLAGWLSLIAGFSGATALAAVTLAAYALPDNTDSRWLAAAVVIASSVLHGIRVRLGSGIQNLAVVLKLGLLLVLCGAAACKLNSHAWYLQGFPDQEMGWAQLVAAMAGSLVWISLSYSGFNAAVYVAEEVALPETTVASAMWRATLLVTMLYIALNAVFVCAVPPQVIAGREDVAAIAAAGLGGPRLAVFVRVTIVLALATSVSSMMMAGPRVYAKMADDGLMPQMFRFAPRQAHRASEAPSGAIWLQCVVTLVLVASLSLRQMLTYLGLTLSLSAAAAVACLFLPHIRHDYRKVCPNHRPWTLLAPGIFVLGTVTNAVVMGVADPRRLWGTVATVVSGGAIYLLMRVRQD